MRIKLALAMLVAIVSLTMTSFHRMQGALQYLGLGDLLGQQAAAEEGGAGEALPNADPEHKGQESDAAGGHHHVPHKIVVTRPLKKAVTLTQQFVCQIHSRRHIEVCALEGGYLQQIKVKEGQSVEQGEVMFQILPTLYSARLDADMAEAQLAQVEFDNTQKLVEQNIVSVQELKLAQAKLAKALAEVKLAKAELEFANIKAPFAGIVDRQMHQEGSLIEEGEVLTTLSDNRVMWAYFNVPEARYLDYQAQLANGQTGSTSDTPADHSLRVELKLANGHTFPQSGRIGAVEADFNNETGNIAFRADFPNEEGLLRNGQTGTVLLHKDEPNAIVIPQRAKYEILAKQYVYVIDAEGIARQREIVVEKELEDIYVIKEGVDENDMIVFEGAQQVRDGDKVDYEFREPGEILANLKNHAE